VADHVGSRPSHHARDSEVHQSQPNNMHMVFLTRNRLAMTSSRHRIIRRPSQHSSFDYVQSTVATEFEDKIRTGSERVGCHTLFFNVFMKFSRDNPAAYHDTNWSMNMSRSDYLSSRMERCREKYSRRNCKMFAVLVLYVRIL